MRKKDSLILADTVESLQDIMQLLTPGQQEELKNSMAIQHFKKNETLYREGEVPQMLHCLIKGKVKIYKGGIGGRTQIIRVVKPVEYFGYRAYFANQNYVTSAAAFESSTVCLIPIELIEKWMMENNHLAMYFIRLLAVEVGKSDQRTVNLTQKHIRGRLAESLIFLRNNYGLEEDSATLSIYLSREDLANMSNMTTSNAIRTLSAFAQEKIIAIDGKKIKIIDGESLERISKIG
ncbi:MAG: Crp/Fnr family transcriptional regulator [Bacteroidaceae bacterium]|nr:Crp/Fnr family transcriptional regulator [Bacteroidaceae bacterium]